jgi:dTDP-4-dehydrorhamnose reductase
VARLPLLFGRSHDGRRGATDMVRAALRDGAALTLFSDEWRTPLHAADAAVGLVSLVLALPAGVHHLPGPERITRAAFGKRFAALHGLDLSPVRTAPRGDPMRPADVSLHGTPPTARSLDAMLRDA